MQKNNKNKRGFSFLEMVVIVAIISIMTSVMMVVTFKERDRKEIEAVGREVTAAIREAQNYALTGKQQGTGLPCSFGFFTDLDDTAGSLNVDDAGTKFEVRGSYRQIDESCGVDYDPDTYLDADNGRVFSKKDLAEEGLEIFGFTSNQHADNSGYYPSAFVAYGVPYGKYYDRETQDIVVGDESIGTEFVIREIGQKDDEYHICVHDTGLIEEIGFVERTSQNESDPVATACVF